MQRKREARHKFSYSVRIRNALSQSGAKAIGCPYSSRTISRQFAIHLVAASWR